MTYTIQGLDPSIYAPLFGLPDEGLRAQGALRVPVTERPGFPCRSTLDDAEPGATMLLVNHVSHDVANPYRASHAIFITEGVTEPARYLDRMPPALDRRILSLRAFDADGLMIDAKLAQPGTADPLIRQLFDAPSIAYIHAHNAVRGCFAAKVERC